MCVGSNRAKIDPFYNQHQFQETDATKLTARQLGAQDERMRRWSQEDLASSERLDQINQQVAQRAEQFKSRQQNLGLNIRGRPGMSGGKRIAYPFPAPRQNEEFNEAGYRQSLINQAMMDRIKSGVYSRGYQVTGTGQQSQATVVGGSSGRRASTSGSPSSRSGGQVTTGPVGTKLNIGS